MTIVKSALLILLIILSCGYLSAQDRLQHADSVVKSKKDVIQSKSDSLRSKLKTDSATTVNVHKADSTVKGVQSKVNELSSVNLTSFTIKSPDSLTQKTGSQLSKVNQTKDSLQQQIAKPVTTVQKKIDEKTSFMDSLNMSVKDPLTGQTKGYGINGPDTNLSNKLSDEMKLPDAKASMPQAPSGDVKLNNDLKVPEVKELGEAGNKAKELQSLPKDQLEKAGVSDEVNAVKSKAQQAGEVTKKAEVYQDEIKNIKEGGLEKAKALPDDAEKLATNIDEVKGLQTETQKFEASKNVLQQYQDAIAIQQINKESALAKGKELGQKEFVDHFSGNEDKLKSGVAQLDKLKRKYGNIPDSRYLPKRAPNQLKGKPFIERIIPGMNFQVFQQMNLVNIDLAPFVAYRIYPRWRAAIGGTYRTQFNKRVHLEQENPAYGFRAFTNYNVFAGFHLHAEYEWMNTIPYNSYLQAFDPSRQKQWIPGLFGGLLKQYKVSKKINGNFQLLYNFLYVKNGLYPNKLTMRFGFEFPMKKKIN